MKYIEDTCKNPKMWNPGENTGICHLNYSDYLLTLRSDDSCVDKNNDMIDYLSFAHW